MSQRNKTLATKALSINPSKCPQKEHTPSGHGLENRLLKYSAHTVCFVLGRVAQHSLDARTLPYSKQHPDWFPLYAAALTHGPQAICLSIVFVRSLLCAIILTLGTFISKIRATQMQALWSCEVS